MDGRVRDYSVMGGSRDRHRDKLLGDDDEEGAEDDYDYRDSRGRGDGDVHADMNLPPPPAADMTDVGTFYCVDEEEESDEAILNEIKSICCFHNDCQSEGDDDGFDDPMPQAVALDGFDDPISQAVALDGFDDPMPQAVALDGSDCDSDDSNLGHDDEQRPGEKEAGRATVRFSPDPVSDVRYRVRTDRRDLSLLFYSKFEILEFKRKFREGQKGARRWKKKKARAKEKEKIEEKIEESGKGGAEDSLTNNTPPSPLVVPSANPMMALLLIVLEALSVSTVPPGRSVSVGGEQKKAAEGAKVKDLGDRERHGLRRGARRNGRGPARIPPRSYFGM